MANQELVEYIKRQFAEGKGQDEVKTLLLSHGWKEGDVAQAFAVVSGVPVPPMPTSDLPMAEPLPGVRGLLKEAGEIFSQRLKTYLGIMLPPTLLLFLVTVFSLTEKTIAQRWDDNGVGTIIFVLLVISSVLLQIWAQLAVLYAVVAGEERIGFKEAYRRAYHGILSYLWVSVISGLVVVGGFVLFFIPGIIMAIYVSLAAYVLVAEGVRGMDALMKSREYVKGNWRRVWWWFFGIGVICIVLIVLPQLPFMLANIPEGVEIMNALSGMVVGPLVAIYSYLAYLKLKAAKGEFVFVPSKSRKAKYWVIGILAPLVFGAFVTIMLVSLNSSREESRDTKRLADLVLIQTKLELYYNDYDMYPASLNELGPEYAALVDPETKYPYEYMKKGENGYEACVQLESSEKRCASVE